MLDSSHQLGLTPTSTITPWVGMGLKHCTSQFFITKIKTVLIATSISSITLDFWKGIPYNIPEWMSAGDSRLCKCQLSSCREGLTSNIPSIKQKADRISSKIKNRCQKILKSAWHSIDEREGRYGKKKNQAALGLYVNNNFVILHVFILKM